MSDNQAISNRVPVVERLLTANEEVAADNRVQFRSHDVKVFNIMASPGAGKTTLLMATIAALAGHRLGVIEGDVASQIDADKIATTGTPVVQINTGGACHLDAPMIRHAVQALPLEDLDLVLVENVGNLICPVSFDLGQDFNVGLISVPEGHDKPYKYPAIFEAVDLVVVTKSDLLPYLDFEVDTFRELVHGLNPTIPIIVVSAKTGEGIGDWIAWLEDKLGRG
ncbi:MAG: hydrogenase nickel incorporation protein HypB [Anaerolineae bacterium]|jgi:hydrogenase nickel incorporation protein HypB|nr:hydrogenase nickel incorporation protein HypB [Anaerolineae bacterium]